MDVAYIATAVGLVAAIAGLLSAYNGRQSIKSAERIAGQQIFGQVTLTEHLRWQNDFRTTMAKFQSILHRVALSEGRSFTINPDDPDKILSDLTFHRDRLTLMLHPTKEDEQDIKRTADELVVQVVEGVSGNTIRDTREKLMELSTTMLHRHWNDIQKRVPQLSEQHPIHSRFCTIRSSESSKDA